VRVRLLGPVDVVVDGEERPVHGLRRKAVLATLALHGGEVVSTDRLVDAVWGETAPATARNTLQSHVSHLRGVLGSKAAILARPPGYLLDLGDKGTDVRLAERLLRQGTQSADPRQGAADLQQALALWRGQPLADVAGLAWLEDQAGRLDLLRQQIERALSELRRAAGEHLQLVPELERLAAGNPLDEHVHAQLMVALYRCGRQADALAAYQRLRATLAEELGLDPGQALRDLETAILRQDRSLDAPVPAGTLQPSAPTAPVPAQLPPAVAAFAGRDAELDSLDTILFQVAREAEGNGGAVIITAIAGTAGVGKTALAVHWAHRVAAQFPDGQLYVNLRGFGPTGAAVEPGQALQGFLEAFAVPSERIPASLDDQVALYRSLLAGKQVLVVLDNARNAEQVRALLPGSPGCLAVVTSRNRLTGLIAREGAHLLSLDVLTPRGARELLTGRLGAHRVDAEPEAAEEIITRCVRLPLALTIAAAHAAASPSFPLGHFAAEIREAGRVLDPFGDDDAATDVRAVFSLSYHALSAGAARLFRLLGLHPGPDITVGAAAGLAGTGSDRARALLAELTSGHLLAEHRPGRYVFHDLLRAYAAEQVDSHDDDAARSAAVGRLLDHCMHTAYAAATLIDPYFAPVAAPTAPRPGAVIGGPATGKAALSWFAAERATLLAAVPLAAEADSGTQAWQLAWVLSTYLLRQGLWTEQATACHVALDAARRVGDTAGEAHALVLLGLGYGPSGRVDEAIPHLQKALWLLETIGGCHRSRVRAHRTLCWIAEQQGRHADMLSHAEAALGLSRAVGDLALEVTSLNDVGYSHALLGNYQLAISYCERSLAGSQEAGERNWESAAWDSLGYIQHQLGQHRQAISCYERSLELDRELADLFNEAVTLDHLGDVHRSAGDLDAAGWAWAQAVRTFEEIGHAGGDDVRAKLAGLHNGPPAVPLGASSGCGAKNVG
jgi:DNA-binding SARP family transcriptional activator/Tfp pilus assembly protein PilF